MVMAIDTLTRLCPGVIFDWRLYAERGVPRYFHVHSDGRRTDDCELNFIKKVTIAMISQKFKGHTFTFTSTFNCSTDI